MPPFKYTKEQYAYAVKLKLQGKSDKEISEITGINVNSLRLHLKKVGVTKKLNSYTNEQYAEAVRLKEVEGKLNKEISEITGISVDSLRLHFKSLNLTKQPNQSVKYSKEQYQKAKELRLSGVSCKEISEITGIREGSLALFFTQEGIVLSTEQRSVIYREYTEEQKKSVLDLRNQGICVADIIQQTGLGKNTVKAILSGADLFLSKELTIKNAGLGKLKKRGYDKWFDYYQDLAKIKKGQILSSEEEYVGAHDYLKWQCEKGHYWEATPATIVMGCWCPYCSGAGSSKAEIEIWEYVKSLMSDPSVVKHGNRSLIAPYEIDVFVEGRDLAIEFDGLFWHSSIQEDFQRDKTLNKYKKIKDKGYKYFLIFEDEWNNKQDLVKAMLRWRLGKFNGKPLHARDLEVVRFDKNSDFEEFFNVNHLNGYGGNSSFAYGLTHEGKLVACASVRKRFNGETEIARFATDYNFNVRGAGGKLVSAIKEELGETPLVSFSDNRLGEGKVYEELGFVCESDKLRSSYYYTDFKRRYNRFMFKRINDPEVLAMFPDVPHEEEAQAMLGVHGHVLFGDAKKRFYRIEDCGHTKWILK